MGFKQFFVNNWRLVNSNNSFVNRFANFHLEPLTAYSQTLVDKKLQLPSKPKKPTPPFFQFLHEKKMEVIEKHNLTLKDSMQVVSQMWKNYDVDIKKKMTDNYKEKLEKYKQELKLYQESLTEDQKNELFKNKHIQIELKTRRKHKKELKELGKPSKPPTAYLMFVIDEIKNRGDMSVVSYMKIIANKWNEIDSNTKTKYVDAAFEANKKYYNELLQWENDMVKAGRFDLIRPCAISNENSSNN